MVRGVAGQPLILRVRFVTGTGRSTCCLLGNLPSDLQLQLKTEGAALSQTGPEFSDRPTSTLRSVLFFNESLSFLLLLCVPLNSLRVQRTWVSDEKDINCPVTYGLKKRVVWEVIGLSQSIVKGTHLF